MMGCGGNQLYSKDGSFIVFNMIGRLVFNKNGHKSIIISGKGKQSP